MTSSLASWRICSKNYTSCKKDDTQPAMSSMLVIPSKNVDLLDVEDTECLTCTNMSGVATKTKNREAWRTTHTEVVVWLNSRLQSSLLPYIVT